MKQAMLKRLTLGLLLMMAYPVKAAEPMPWPQTALDGSRLELVAGKPAYLYFFAHWCETYLMKTEVETARGCAQATQAMQAIEARFGGQVQVIGIASPMSAGPDGVRAFIGRHGIKYPVVFDGRGDLFAAYKVANFPLSILIDDQGQERERTIGTVSAGRIKDLLAMAPGIGR